MRNISAKELSELAQYHLERGNEPLAQAYRREEAQLQDEMNRD